MNRLSQILKMLDTSGEEERSLADDLTAEERVQMGTPEEWSFTDDVAHYAFWRQRLAENLAAIAEGRPPEWKEWFLELEERNRMIFEQYQLQSLEEILEFSETALADLIEAVRSVEHELETIGLNPPSSQELPLWRRIVGTGYLHPMFHLGWYALRRGDTARDRHLNLTMANQSMDLDDSPHWQGTVTYNQACYHSLVGETEQAIELLGPALELKPDLIELARKDPDLDPIRSDPAFQQIFADLESKA